MGREGEEGGHGGSPRSPQQQVPHVAFFLRAGGGRRRGGVRGGDAVECISEFLDCSTMLLVYDG